jgi:hypothetical protein
VYVALEWPPYWTPTSDQIQKMAQALSTATGAKQIISSESAVRQLARVLGSDADAEVRRVEAEKSAGLARFMASGLVSDPDAKGDDDDEEEGEGEDGDGTPPALDGEGEGEDDDDDGVEEDDEP